MSEQILLNQAHLETHSCLGFLRELASIQDASDQLETLRSCVRHLSQALATKRPELKKYMLALDTTFSLCGESYPSAHAAVFGVAQSVLIRIGVATGQKNVLLRVNPKRITKGKLDRCRRTLAFLDSRELAAMEPKKTTPPDIPEYLANWREILVALGMKNNVEDKQKVFRLNKTYSGPIQIPGQGRQPFVEKMGLLKWWAGLKTKVQQSEQRQRDAQATVASGYNFSRDGEVTPDISGGVKKRRRDRKP